MGFIILLIEVLLQKEEKFSLKNRLPVEKGVINENDVWVGKSKHYFVL